MYCWKKITSGKVKTNHLLQSKKDKKFIKKKPFDSNQKAFL